MLEPWVAWSASLPAVCPVYLFTSVGLQGASHHTACPVLCHSESSPLGLSVHECRAAGSASGQTACPVRPTLLQSWSPVSVPLVPPQQCESSLPRLLSPPLLPVWMNVYFLFPWCQTSFPFDFLSVLVVQGGAVCLPTPPSWFSAPTNLNDSDCIALNMCQALL